MVSFDFTWIGEYQSLILAGIQTTIFITVIGGGIGFALGLVTAWCRVFGPTALRRLPSAYVETIRNTPFIIQLYFIYFALPSVGILISGPTAAACTMIVNFGAYSSEIMRAGIEATPKGQFEAGQSLALSERQVFRYIVLKPALARIWPALCSQLVLLMFGSSVISQISVEDLTYAANFIQSRNFRAFETYIVSTVIYLVLGFLMRRLLDVAGWFLFYRRVRS